MTKGIVVLAQNNEKVDYVQQACLLALSLKKHNPEELISIITDDAVPAKYVDLFDNIIPIIWNDDAADFEWKIQNRWKIYHMSPYDKTIVLDTDILILQNISSWWDFLDNYEMFFTNKVYTYRGTLIENDYYRKTFTSNNLPNLYSGFHYFEKGEFAHKFYKWLEFVVQNWQKFYEIFLKDNRPSWCSIDVCSAIVTIILDCEDKITNKVASFPNFVHMKSQIQDWLKPKSNWQDCVDVYMNQKGQLKIGNFQQIGILHYTEKDFVKPYMLNTYMENIK
jgi:hypothetical protein